MSSAATIHDAYFKRVLSDQRAADLFLREHLPRDVVELFTPEPPELLPGSFVDEELGQHHSDLLFKIQLKTGQDALAYLLVEHKSSPDDLARLQLLRYVVRILTRWYKEHEYLPLPPVLPLVAHHGPNGWGISCEFRDLFGDIPGPLSPYAISFRHALVDFAFIEDTALSAHIHLRTHLKALKYVLRPDLPGRLEALLVDGKSLSILDVIQILAYIGKGPVPVSREALREVLRRFIPNHAEEIMQGFGQQYFEEGKAQGKTEGEAQVLVWLLEKRLGAVSEALRARIFSADLTSIESWIHRAIDATELESVFGRN